MRASLRSEFAAARLVQNVQGTGVRGRLATTSGGGLVQSIANHIDGRSIPPLSGRHLDNFEPAMGEVYSRVPDSGAEDIAAAVAAAKSAFPAWSGMPAAERSRVLLTLADLIDGNLDTLAAAESRDSGKPI